MAIDLDRVRTDTPGCAHVAHFNNAGAALLPRPVLDAVRDHRELEARLGGYEAARVDGERIAHAYAAVADLLRAQPSEVALVDSATRAFTAALQSIRFARGDRILTSVAEYASNFIPLLQLAKTIGVDIEVVPDDESGQLDVEALSSLLDNRVKLVVLTHVPSTGGLVNPAEAVGELTRAAGVFYLLDACQSIGQLDLDVGRLGCDFLSATARKYLRGPRGVGLLYVRGERMDELEPFPLDMHGAEWVSRDRYRMAPGAARFETFEYDPAARIGLGVAVDYALGLGLPPIEARVVALASDLREGLRSVPGVSVHDRGRRLCGIVTFTVDGVDAGRVCDLLRDRAINTWVSVGSTTLLDLEPRGLGELVRASVHYYNSEAEIDLLVETVAALARHRDTADLH